MKRPLVSQSDNNYPCGIVPVMALRAVFLVAALPFLVQFQAISGESKFVFECIIVRANV